MGQAAEQYERDGYWIADERIAPDEVLERALQRMVAVRDGVFDTGLPPTKHPGYDSAVLCKIDNPHRSDTGLRGLATCPQVGRKVAEITGARRVQVWASQLLIKPPGSAAAGHVGWHQDRQYWHVWQHDEGLFTAWIALSEVKEESGPMLFVRGSHRWGFLDQGDFYDKDQGKLREGIAVPAGAAWEEVPALMPSGGFSVHHCLTYHGSNANVSEAPRCSLAVHMRDERAVPKAGDQSFYSAHLEDPRMSPVIYEA